MNNNALFHTGKKPVIFDGAMGTYLQTLGSYPNAPVTYNLTNPEIISGIHAKYLEAGAEVITANTFGAYRFKYRNFEDIIKQALDNIKNAISGYGKKEIFAALDLGPTGKLTPPMGNTSFIELYNIFKETAILGEKYGADFALIETMQDIGEMRAAILAVKENTSMPVFCTVSFDKNGKTLSGADALTVISVLEALNIDAIGINCGVGMDSAENVIDDFMKYSSVPVLIQPNAGLPETVNGVTSYKMPPVDFANRMRVYAEKGVRFLGGCCGTTPEHIRLLSELVSNITTKEIKPKNFTVTASYSKHILFSEEPVKIGKAVCTPVNGNIEASAEDAAESSIDEYTDGAQIICISVCCDDKSENTAAMIASVEAISKVCSAPLMIESDDTNTLETVLRNYNGKAAVIGLTNETPHLDSILPVIKKYGSIIIFKCISEEILDKTDSYGIPRRDVLIRPALKL